MNDEKLIRWIETTPVDVWVDAMVSEYHEEWHKLDKALGEWVDEFDEQVTA